MTGINRELSREEIARIMATPSMQNVLQAQATYHYLNSRSNSLATINESNGSNGSAADIDQVQVQGQLRARQARLAAAASLASITSSHSHSQNESVNGNGIGSQGSQGSQSVLRSHPATLTDIRGNQSGLARNDTIERWFREQTESSPPNSSGRASNGREGQVSPGRFVNSRPLITRATAPPTLLNQPLTPHFSAQPTRAHSANQGEIQGSHGNQLQGRGTNSTNTTLPPITRDPTVYCGNTPVHRSKNVWYPQRVPKESEVKLQRGGTFVFNEEVRDDDGREGSGSVTTDSFGSGTGSGIGSLGSGTDGGRDERTPTGTQIFEQQQLAPVDPAQFQPPLQAQDHQFMNPGEILFQNQNQHQNPDELQLQLQAPVQAPVVNNLDLDFDLFLNMTLEEFSNTFNHLLGQLGETMVQEGMIPQGYPESHFLIIVDAALTYIR